MHILNSPTIGHNFPGDTTSFPGDFTDFGDGDAIDFSGSTTVDLGNGQIMVLGPNGEFLGIRAAPTSQLGHRPQDASARALDVAQIERLGAQTGIEQSQLAQFDRELDFR
ncbi:hypothetical protein LCGC14_1342570, partial [marine sediment metagenome]